MAADEDSTKLYVIKAPYSEKDVYQLGEWFLLRQDINREVIMADITRYLGNDALVRPGNYEIPNSRNIIQGYFITAYTALTEAMIESLKEDSNRWEIEKEAALSPEVRIDQIRCVKCWEYVTKEFFPEFKSGGMIAHSQRYREKPIPRISIAEHVYESRYTGHVSRSYYHSGIFSVKPDCSQEGIAWAINNLKPKEKDLGVGFAGTSPPKTLIGNSDVTEKLPAETKGKDDTAETRAGNSLGNQEENASSSENSWICRHREHEREFENAMSKKQGLEHFAPTSSFGYHDDGKKSLLRYEDWDCREGSCGHPECMALKGFTKPESTCTSRASHSQRPMTSSRQNVRASPALSGKTSTGQPLKQSRGTDLEGERRVYYRDCGTQYSSDDFKGKAKCTRRLDSVSTHPYQVRYRTAVSAYPSRYGDFYRPTYSPLRSGSPNHDEIQRSLRLNYSRDLPNYEQQQSESPHYIPHSPLPSYYQSTDQDMGSQSRREQNLGFSGGEEQDTAYARQKEHYTSAQERSSTPYEAKPSVSPYRDGAPDYNCDFSSIEHARPPPLAHVYGGNTMANLYQYAQHPSREGKRIEYKSAPTFPHENGRFMDTWERVATSPAYEPPAPILPILGTWLEDQMQQAGYDDVSGGGERPQSWVVVENENRDEGEEEEMLDGDLEGQVDEGVEEMECSILIERENKSEVEGELEKPVHYEFCTCTLGRSK
ncbi:hypothetical protein G7Y89_g10308 [Cudoniella acicularis]|uniref:Uncharacterized protein n=1 Tax=Cudoniella acicularis TaxID=354080 RepID=A0A8H4RFC7_9HELO|nr:hypothetical protein G7Y89_g10308 [Cudoniella acicularis]